MVSLPLLCETESESETRRTMEVLEHRNGTDMLLGGNGVLGGTPLVCCGGRGSLGGLERKQGRRPGLEGGEAEADPGLELGRAGVVEADPGLELGRAGVVEADPGLELGRAGEVEADPGLELGRAGVVEAAGGVEERVEGLEECVEERVEEQSPGPDALRCQVKITTRRSLRLHMANHTARDVYVRLLGHGGRVSGTGLSALKDSVHLSPLKPSSAEAELQGVEAGGPAPRPHAGEEERIPRGEGPTKEGRGHQEEEEDEEETSGALTISELVYSPCASMLPTPVDDGQGGVDLLFQSPAHSPAQLLRELHADPEIQAQMAAERERDRAYERARQAGRGVLSSGLRLLSGNQRVNACMLSAARLAAVVAAVFLVAVPTLLLLLESDLDVSFLHEIRQTPEFQQFHHEYYCPLRGWVSCRVSRLVERLGGD